MGRGDLQNCFSIRYSVLTQTMGISRLVKFRELIEMLSAMSGGVQRLCALAGVLRMLRCALLMLRCAASASVPISCFGVFLMIPRATDVEIG